MNRMKFQNWLQHTALPLVIAGFIGVTPCLLGFHPSVVVGNSMAPTLQDQSIHFIGPIWNPKVGDIVTVMLSDEDYSLVKRIVAGPGDAVLHQGEMLILGADEYYVMGDNRDASTDSRIFGPVCRDEITGQLLF